MIYGGEASAQSVVIDEAQGLIIVLDIALRDLQEVDRCFQERDVLREMEMEKDKTIVELKKSLGLIQKELDLERKENDLNERIIKIQEREIAGINRNFEQMKEVADRAIKLAETSKPKSNWQILGVIGVLAFVIGLAIGL
jgi:hypothetical protein